MEGGDEEAQKEGRASETDRQSKQQIPGVRLGEGQPLSLLVSSS